jgi:hypothetical protein
MRIMDEKVCIKACPYVHVDHLQEFAITDGPIASGFKRLPAFVGCGPPNDDCTLSNA